MDKEKEIKLIEKTAATLAELDMYFERLSNDNLEKLNICSKSKELVFWFTYYKEKLENEEGDVVE